MCATHRKHLILVIAMFLVLLASLSTPAYAEENVIKIGVLAYRGEEEALTMWTPTADYLSEQVPGYTFVIVPLDNDNIAPAVERAEVDFVTTNPGSYVGLEYKYGVSRIATLKNLRQGNDYEVFGAVIFTTADRGDINDLKDLKGKSFMAVHEDAFGGWWMAWKEFKDNGIDPHREFSTLKFSGFPHDLIVYAVKDGEVDAGTVRTDTLERMAEDGLIEIDEFKILNQQHVEGFPFMLSTRLYPEWTFAKLRHAPDELSEKVAVALLTMPADSRAAKAAKCAGWTIPLDYNPVHECLKELRVEPYEGYGEVTLGEVLRQYWYDVVLIIAALLLMVFATRHVMGINKKLQYEIAERKRTERKLKRSWDFVQTIMDNMADPMLVINISDYKVQMANGAARKHLKGNDPVAMSLTCYQTIHNRDTPCGDQDEPCPLRQVIDTKKPARVMHVHHDEADNELFVDIVVTPIFDENGEVIQIIESSRDITEIKKTEKALRETSDYLEKLIDYTNAPFIVWNPESRITRVNHAFEHLTGYTSDELLYKNMQMLFPDSSLHETLSEINRTLSGEYWELLEIPILHKDGTIRLTLWNSANLYGEDGTTVLAIIAQGIDITERKQAEEALRLERDNLINILDTMADGAYIVDQQYNIQYVNPVLKKDFGQVDGRKCYEYFYDREDACPWCKNPDVLAGKTVRWESYSSKTNKTYDLVDTPLKNPDGSISKFEIFHDITDRKRAEKALKQYAEELKSSNELKDLFTDILRHDLLNPAGIVKGFTEVLLNMEDDEKKHHLLEKIEKSNEKLINMIQSAAKFAKLQSVDEIDFEEKYLDIIFNDVANNFKPMLDEKRMTLDFIAEGTYPANVNPMIEEVFANMMSNAIKYSPQESRIIVDILDSDEKWKVTVTDFGNGISDEDKPKIFTRFKRVDKSGVKGTGLGLAIVKRIIKLHGGEVGVEDNPAGQGSVFWVTVGKA